MDGITTSIITILKNLMKNFNTLLDCPVRFSGEYNEEKVHRFIEYIEYYKRIKCIEDEQALRELQYLLMDQAHDWWLRRKVKINTWSEALTILENQYSKKRALNVVFTEILKHHYEDYESKDDFIDDKIELFYELSEPELKENSKLEIIYALLPKDIQNKIKLLNITSIKELKEQLKLVQLHSVDTSSKSETINTVLSQVEVKDVTSNESISQEKNGQIAVINTSSENHKRADSERNSIIKVRRAEDLMPQDIKEEEESLVTTEEFLSSDTEPSFTNNVLHSSQDNFQIDTDIMNQINNIIDESEMNMNAISINQNVSSVLTQPSNCVASLEFLGFHIEASKQSNKSVDQSKSQVKTSKKLKKRCTYCRHFNHTAQICFKRAKHMKLFPEKFMQSIAGINNNISQCSMDEEAIEVLPITPDCNISAINTSPTEPLSTIPILLNQVVTSPPLENTSLADTSSNGTLNNIAEKCINPILTTKLIAPINGKMPNRTLAAKLRSINTPSPKCHQCGTLGFYKSICPNCSPIYNNNNHNQYNK